MEYTLFFLAAFFASIFATVAGFGSSTLLVPVAILFFDFKIALFLVGAFHLFNNIFKVRLLWKDIDRKIFLQFGLVSIVFTFIGAYFASTVDSKLLTKIMAVFLIIFSVTAQFWKSLKIQNRTANMVSGGTLSGFFAGLIGLGGAIRSAFLITLDLPKKSYVATSAMIAMIVDLTRLPTYLAFGKLDLSVFAFIFPILILIAYVGVRIGKMFLEKISVDLFKRIVYITLFCIGIRFLFV